jgi:hypothetical protein
MADHGAVLVYLSSGQTVRLPLRRVGRGIERAPVGYEAFEEWLGKRPEVLMYQTNAVAFAIVTPSEPGAGDG